MLIQKQVIGFPASDALATGSDNTRQARNKEEQAYSIPHVAQS
jgi:hypothetical protein